MEKLEINYDKLPEFCSNNNFIIIKDKMLEAEGMGKYLPYATDDNFVGKAVYPENMPLIMHTEVWQRLCIANGLLREFDLCAIIHDAYRPSCVQKLFYDYFIETHGYADESLVASFGTHNTTPNAIDVMPGGIINDNPSLLPKEEFSLTFDDFSDEGRRSRIDFSSCTYIEKFIRDNFVQCFKKSGFKVNESEFWHFMLPYFDIGVNYSDSMYVPKGEEEVFRRVKTLK